MKATTNAINFETIDLKGGNDIFNFEDGAPQVADEILMGAGNDKANFWGDAEFDCIDFGEGIDTLNIGDNANIEFDSVVFDGDDVLTIGKNATLTITDAFDTDLLASLKIADGGTLILADADSLTKATSDDRFESYWSKIIAAVN